MSTHLMTAVAGVLVFAGVACSSEESSSTPNNTGLASQSEIANLLTTATYRSWGGDTMVRDALVGSPHGRVRVYFNSLLHESLKNNMPQHPVGAISVKELYSSHTLSGYSVSYKVIDTADKDSWVWYEIFSITNLENPAYYGRGHNACHSCHASGKDYVRSPLPGAP